MIKENINNMIMAALKDGQKDEAGVYRLVKNEFLKFSTAKNAGELNDSAEVAILQKMIKQRKESIENYNSANRLDLVAIEQSEIDILEKLLPSIATKEDVINYIVDQYPNGIEKSSMGSIIKSIKDKFIGVDGKMVADIVKKSLIK